MEYLQQQGSVGGVIEADILMFSMNLLFAKNIVSIRQKVNNAQAVGFR